MEVHSCLWPIVICTCVDEYIMSSSIHKSCEVPRCTRVVMQLCIASWANVNILAFFQGPKKQLLWKNILWIMDISWCGEYEPGNLGNVPIDFGMLRHCILDCKTLKLLQIMTFPRSYMSNVNEWARLSFQNWFSIVNSRSIQTRHTQSATWIFSLIV